MGTVLAACAVPLMGAAMNAGNRGRKNLVLPGRGHSLPFSDAVLVGDTLYLAGRIGFDPATGKPAAKAEATSTLR
jgi:enamine deaminase RidA (YjgF/YER057c/UK114 family)